MISKFITASTEVKRNQVKLILHYISWRNRIAFKHMHSIYIWKLDIEAHPNKMHMLDLYMGFFLVN